MNDSTVNLIYTKTHIFVEMFTKYSIWAIGIFAILYDSGTIAVSIQNYIQNSTGNPEEAFLQIYPSA